MGTTHNTPKTSAFHIKNEPLVKKVGCFTDPDSITFGANSSIDAEIKSWLGNRGYNKNFIIDDLSFKEDRIYVEGTGAIPKIKDQIPYYQNNQPIPFASTSSAGIMDFGMLLYYMRRFLGLTQTNKDFPSMRFPDPIPAEWKGNSELLPDCLVDNEQYDIYGSAINSTLQDFDLNRDYVYINACILTKPDTQTNRVLLDYDNTAQLNVDKSGAGNHYIDWETGLFKFNSDVITIVVQTPGGQGGAHNWVHKDGKIDYENPAISMWGPGGYGGNGICGLIKVNTSMGSPITKVEIWCLNLDFAPVEPHVYIQIFGKDKYNQVVRDTILLSYGMKPEVDDDGRDVRGGLQGVIQSNISNFGQYVTIDSIYTTETRWYANDSNPDDKFYVGRCPYTPQSFPNTSNALKLQGCEIIYPFRYVPNASGLRQDSGQVGDKWMGGGATAWCAPGVSQTIYNKDPDWWVEYAKYDQSYYGAGGTPADLDTENKKVLPGKPGGNGFILIYGHK